VPEDGVQAFLDPLEVGRLWGVGKVTNATLERLGIRTIGQLRRLPSDTLGDLFGEQGEHLHLRAQGIDARRVVPDRVAKSISHETTFARDIDDDEVLAVWLHELADQVGRRLRACQLFGETVHLKLRFRDFRTVTRSQKLQNPTDVSQEIADTVTTLFRERIQQNRLPVRLVGVGVSQLNQGGLRQKLLFDEAAHDAERELDATRDKIAAKFGQAALVRGAKLLHRSDRGKPRDESQ
ncbi:MAG: DNA polymerase IV, partial [Planctomycetota bacterium]